MDPIFIDPMVLAEKIRQLQYGMEQLQQFANSAVAERDHERAEHGRERAESSHAMRNLRFELDNLQLLRPQPKAQDTQGGLKIRLPTASPYDPSETAVDVPTWLYMLYVQHYCLF